MKSSSKSSRKKNKKTDRMMSRSELDFALENGTFSKKSKFNAASFEEASYINVDEDDKDEISELKNQRHKTFKQMEPTYQKGLDEYVKLRKSGQPTIKKNGNLSRKEPLREKESNSKKLTIEMLQTIMQSKETIFNLVPTLDDIEFERLVKQQQEYTDLTYCLINILNQSLKIAFYTINELGWDIPVTRDLNSSILEGSLEFTHEKKKIFCHHFVYFGDIVKPSQNGKNLENYNPAVEYIPVKMQVFGNDSTSTVLKKEFPFDFLLFSASEDDEETTFSIFIINPGFVLDQN